MPDYLTVPQAAAILKLKRRQVQVYCKSGRLPALRLANGNYLIDRADLEAFAALPRKRGGYRPRRQPPPALAPASSTATPSA